MDLEFLRPGSRPYPQYWTVNPTHIEHPRTDLRTEITRIYKYNNNNMFAYFVDKFKNIETVLKHTFLYTPERRSVNKVEPMAYQCNWLRAKYNS